MILISSLILGGVMTIFLFLTRSGINAQHYRDMDSEARRALEFLSRDMKMADSIRWTGTSATTTKVRLTIPTWDIGTNALSSKDVYYRLVPVPANSSLRARLGPQFLGRFETSLGGADPDSDGIPDEEQYQPLQTYVSSLEFRRFERGDTYVEAANDLETKQVKLELLAERKTVLVTRAR